MKKAEAREVGNVKLTNIDIAVYALYRLGGAASRVHTEEVAMECYRLAPDRFSWELYPEYPDSEPGRSALFDARKPQSGALVTGSKGRGKGWMLTLAGIDRVKLLLPELGKLGVAEPQMRSDRQLMQRYLNDLERHPAYRKFALTGSCETVEDYEFADFLRCGVDSGSRVIRERLDRVRNRAYEAGRTGIVEFLRLCEARFENLMK